MANYHVLTIGDAKLDAFLSLEDTNEKVRLDQKTGELCFKHGEKICVSNTYISLGGNAANVCVGLTRLGIKATIAAEIGDDEFALKITNSLGKEHIDKSFIRQTHGKPSSITVAINFKNDRTLFSEHIHRTHEFHYHDSSFEWIYLTSLGDEWTHAYTKAIAYVHDKPCSLAFNPGTMATAGKIYSCKRSTPTYQYFICQQRRSTSIVRTIWTYYKTYG